MDSDIQKSPQLGYPINVGDAKYVSGLSTILVATIQEAKDRISQIEYIFCSQLFPNFQSNSKSLQKVYSDVRRAAEDSWKEKESSLFSQLKQLQLENMMIIQENQSLKLENARFASNYRENFGTKFFGVANCEDAEKMMKELEEKNVMLSEKQRNLELKSQEAPEDLIRKLKEVDESMDLHNRLLQLVQSKASSILQKEEQLKLQEEKKNELLDQIGCLEKNFGTIQEQLHEKSKEVMKEKELHKKTLQENELYLLKNLQNEQLLIQRENEKKMLMTKVQSLEESVDELYKELKKKNVEVNESRSVQEQHLEQIDLNSKEMLKITQQLEKLEKENILLLTKRKCLEEKVDKLEEVLRDRTNEASKGMELHGNFLQQIEEKDSEIQSEKKKRKDLIAAYKILKSQYNFLLAKFGLTNESLNRPSEMEDDNNPSKHGHSPLTSPDNDVRPWNSSKVSLEITKDEDFVDDKEVGGLVRRPGFASPTTSDSPLVPKEERSGLLAGIKRPVSSWRDTRSHQRRGGLDPHDNFLDTPLENIIGNIKKHLKEEQMHDIPDPTPMDHKSSDDETQELNRDFVPQKLVPVPEPGIGNGFKYIESVRKRADRENLKGIECKQCRKFYDAVRPDGDDGNKQQQFRCEHHDGVSRHRYKYAPPLTPEGFWNIGFESGK